MNRDLPSNSWVIYRRATAATPRRHRRGMRQAWRLAAPFALALLLAQLQAQAAISAAAPPPAPFDLWGWASGWLQRHGRLGFAILVGLLIVGWVLDKTEGLEALLRLLGWDRKPLDPSSAPRNETRGPNSPVITGGTLSAERDLVFGEKHEHHTHLPPPPKPELPKTHTPHNLPDCTTSPVRFVGRAAELQRLAALLAPEGSKAYLTGMGGVGKSELALQYAYDALEHYRGGIVLLDARQGLTAMASQLVSFVRNRFPAVSLPDDTSPIDLLPSCWSQWPAGATSPEPVLLILDDQKGDREGYAAERQLLAGLPPRFRRLLTQWEPAPTGATAIDLPLLRREASLELLALQAGEHGGERLQA